MLPSYRNLARVIGTALLALGGASGCLTEGQVELDLQMPEERELSPVEAEIGEIGLFTYLPDAEPRSETRQVGAGDGPLSMGRLDVGQGIRLAVEMRTANRRLVGYGRSPGSFDVAADETVVVPMKMRRPFAYVSGRTAGLATFDTTKDATVTQSYRGVIPLGRAPLVSIPTNDGADVAVLSSAGTTGELTLLSTSNHQPTPNPAVPVAAPPTDAAVSPDNKWVVVGHDGDGGGVSIVNLEAAREGRAEGSFVGLGSVGAVAMGARAENPMAVALLDRATTSGCPTGGRNSRIAAIGLGETASETPLIIDHSGPLHDIAVSDDGETVVAADACNGRLQRFSLVDDVQPTELALVPNATAVAIQDDRAWAVGTLLPDGNQSRRLIVVSVNLDGTGEVRVELPPAIETARSNDFTADGQAAEQRMEADDLFAYDIAVAPGSDHFAVLTWAYYHGVERGDFLGQPIIPEMDMESREFVLVNASTTAVVQRVRTQCLLDWVSDAFNPPILDDWDCGRAAGQDVSDEAYDPRHLSILYGGR